MPHKTNAKKSRLKNLANSKVPYKVVKGKRRRLCSEVGCEKYAQRKELCSKHQTESDNQRPPPRSATISDQSSAHPTTEQSQPNLNEPFHSTAITAAPARHSTIDRDGEVFLFDNSKGTLVFAYDF